MNFKLSIIADLAASFTTSESLRFPVIDFIVSFFFLSSSYFIFLFFSITSDIVLVKFSTLFNAFFDILRFNFFDILFIILFVNYFAGDNLFSKILFVIYLA